MVDTGGLKSSGQKVSFPACFSGISLGFFSCPFSVFIKNLKTFYLDMLAKQKGTSGDVSGESLCLQSLA